MTSIALTQKGEPMTNSEAVNWLINISADIGKAEHRDLWHYEQALSEIREMLESAQPEQRWIPVTKRLPKNRDWVLGIFQEGDTGWINPIPFICDYVGKKTPITTQDNWLLKLVDEPHPYYENLHCIAWMPLPETWEEGEQG